MVMIFTYLYNAIKKILYNIIIAGCDQTEKILEFKRKFICSAKINLSDEFNVFKKDDNDELVDLIETETVCNKNIVKTNFKSNTSPNLAINKNFLNTNLKNKSIGHLNVSESNSFPAYKPEWYCCTCKRKLSAHANMYCCNDNIFCSSNCRDRYLNYFRLNNNI